MYLVKYFIKNINIYKKSFSSLKISLDRKMDYKNE
jgi:hypothetical protein